MNENKIKEFLTHLSLGKPIDHKKRKPVSERRNPLIADIFHKVHYVEKWGTGIGRIRKLESKTEFKELSNAFIVIFKRKTAEYLPRKVIEKFKITKEQLKDKNLPKQMLIDWLGEGCY